MWRNHQTQGANKAFGMHLSTDNFCPKVCFKLIYMKSNSLAPRQNVCHFRSKVFNYPRPVLAFGYCRCLRLCVCVRQSVCQSLACPRDNSGPVQARNTKFRSHVQNNLVKVPIVLWSNWPWPSRSDIGSKLKFTPFWACPHHNSSPIQARITKFGPEVQNTLVEIPIVLEAIELDIQDQIKLKKSKFPVSPQSEIHNYRHVTSREPWVPRPLHSPDSFMVTIQCMYLYT